MVHALGAARVVRSPGLCLRPDDLSEADTLQAIGGLQSLANYLADDHRLGELVSGLGLRIVLSPYVVRADHHEPSWDSLARHELRWMRTIRALPQGSYRFLFLKIKFDLGHRGYPARRRANVGLDRRMGAIRGHGGGAAGVALRALAAGRSASVGGSMVGARAGSAGGLGLAASLLHLSRLLAGYRVRGRRRRRHASVALNAPGRTGGARLIDPTRLENRSLRRQCAGPRVADYPRRSRRLHCHAADPGHGGLGAPMVGTLSRPVRSALCHRLVQLLRPYDAERHAGFGYVFWVTTVREAVDRLLPVASVGGGVLAVRLLRWRGLAVAPIGATVIVEILLTLIVLYLFAALGLFLFFELRRDGPAIPVAWCWRCCSPCRCR